MQGGGFHFLEVHLEVQEVVQVQEVVAVQVINNEGE
jgi:hypothetical protein